MANNRLGIMCNPCREVLWFAKTMLDGYYLSDRPEKIGKELSYFLDKHTYCPGGRGDGDFKLIYENDDESDGTTDFRVPEDEEI